jgi:hypothetical protein
MIPVEDRRSMTQMIEVAHRDGARLSQACEVAGIDLRTLQRWKAQDGLAKGDGRPDALRPMPAHALTPEERAAVLAVANEPRFADPPSAASSKKPGRTPTVGAPKARRPSGHRKPMWPPPLGRCGAGT